MPPAFLSQLLNSPIFMEGHGGTGGNFDKMKNLAESGSVSTSPVKV